MTIVVVVIENTFCRASECYVYTGPDNEVTRQKAIKGFKSNLAKRKMEIPADVKSNRFKQIRDKSDAPKKRKKMEIIIGYSGNRCVMGMGSEFANL